MHRVVQFIVIKMNSTLNQFNADEKILQYQDKIHNYIHGHETLISFELDLTNKCNNRCPKCVGVKSNGAELSFEQINSIIEQMSELDVKSVVISGGGEPLCSPHFISTLYNFQKRGISIGLNSNGLALDDDSIDAILNTCKYFRISLDAGSAFMYKITHGMEEEEFWRVVENIKRLVDLKREYNSSTVIGIGYLTGLSTVKGIMDFFKLSSSLGVDFAQLRPFTNECADVGEYIKHGKGEYPNLNITSSMHKYIHATDSNPRPYTTCHGMYFNTVITADYKMWACIHHRQDSNYFLGDLNEISIKDILKGDDMKNVQRGIKFNECPLFCRNDAINRTLSSVCSNVNHKEFL